MKDIIVKQFFAVLDYICSGGIVMIPLLLISVVMWSIIVERIMMLKYYKKVISNLDLNNINELEKLSLFSRIKPDQHISVIKILSSIAPLLGLLGTVIGMIKTFEIIAYFGTGNPKLMANGISEALITTQTGLVIAIPGIYMGRFLEREAQILKQRLDSIVAKPQ